MTIKRKPNQTGAGDPSQSQVSRMLRRADEADVGERPQPRGITEAQRETKRQVDRIGKMIEVFERLTPRTYPDQAYEDYSKELAKLDYTLGDVERLCDYIKDGNWDVGAFISAAINKIIKEGEVVRLRPVKKLDFLGMMLERGTVEIEGDAGSGLGVDMKGGRIVVGGNAGDYVGEYMKGGRIVVGGKAGDFVGLISEGGEITIKGGYLSIDPACKAKVIGELRNG